MIPFPKQVETLPLWAREHIASLERATAEAQRVLAELCDAAEGPHEVSVLSSKGYEHKRQLSSDAVVRFDLAVDPSHASRKIQVSVREGALHVHADGPLTIEAVGSNWFRVYITNDKQS